MGFLFWKRKRSEEAEQPGLEQPHAEQQSVEPEQALAPEIVDREPSTAVDYDEPTPEAVAVPKIESESEKHVSEAGSNAQTEPQVAQPEPVLISVELPKRSAKKGIRSLFSRIKFDPENLDELEDILLQADFGVDASLQIVGEVKARAKKSGAATETQLKQILSNVITEQLTRDDSALNLSDGKLPYVFLVVGVNGVGKTTTIGKLANWLSEGDWSVVIGAADTFRAAAVDQIATWADRARAVLVRPKLEGQDPASVAFESVDHAIANDADILIIDTAGRLQNKTDLMAELEKIRRVVEKRAQINEVLLVIDATTGQNGLSQAKAFAEIAKVTGVVLTKLDGTAKGGIVYAIQRELGIPVKLVGVGEGINDFAFFDAREFAEGLVG